MPESLNPLELRVTLTSKGKTTETRLYCAELGIDAGPFRFKAPLDEKALTELRWYLEQYTRWPVGPDVERAERVKAQLAGWGKALFEALISPKGEALRVWTQFRMTELERPHLLTLDCTLPEVLRLPWELLADEEGHLFALGISFRRRLHKAQAAMTRSFSLPVRVLMVIARPEDERVAFIDPRASSQALLAALETLGPEAATVEFLPVGTLAALDERLANQRAAPVHVVHFDGHGVYDRHAGLGYLVFEDAEGGADLVDAEKLGTLLARSGVPLMVLDACQSAQTDAENPFSSVAPRLIQAGIGSVVAMQYSVLVPASKRFFAAFYKALTQGETIGQAMDAGRRALLRDEFRFTLHHPDGSDHPIALRDWFLPALYQQAADPAPFFNAETQRDRDAERQESAQADARALEKARHVLALLEEKAAGYGKLARPVHLEVELEEQRKAVAELEARRHDAAGEREGATAQPREARGLATLLAQLEGDPGEADARKLAEQLRECWRAGARDAEQDALLKALDAVCERALGLPFAALLPEEVPSEAESDAETGARLLGEFPETRYGFVGRALELWKLERLMAERRVIVLHAFGGQGKTALATEAAEWLTRKGRFARAVFLSFEQGGAADWALTQLGRLLLGNAFSALGEAERLPALLQALDAAPTLLLWDNFESVLAGAHAALAPQDLAALLELGATLGARAATTRLLVTTRDAELPHEAFRPGKRTALLPLEGLMRWEALELAGAVLDALGAPRPPRLELERLLDFLGGHPLSIQLVTPHLREYPNVQTVIERFEALYPGFTEGQAQRRDESLEVSLRFSLERLSEAVRERIAALGVFEGGAFEMQILKVTGLKPSEWQRARAELVRAGLARVEMESPFSINTEEGKFGGHFLRFHPTLAPALRRQLGEAQLAALEEAYWQAYYALAQHLYFNDSKDPQTTRAVAQRELPNLRRGVTLALRAAPGTAVTFAECVELFLRSFGRLRERDAMMAEVERAVGGPMTDDRRPQTADGGPQGEGAGPLTRAQYLLQSRRGEMLQEAGRARDAEKVFRGLLARMEREAAETGEYERAQTLGRLGRSLEGQGRAGEAEEVYRQALAALAALAGGAGGPSTDVRRQTGAIHTDLADVLRDQGRYAEAREQYEAALEDIRAIADDRSEAAILGQLGTLALMEGDFEEAERRYREALARFAAMGETRSEAILWHQLGMVYQEAAGRAGEGSKRAALLQQADEAYGQSLQLKEALGDRAGAARTANQLAQVAQMAGRAADAARWYRRALRDFQASGQVRYVAGTCNNLAGLLLDAARGEYGSPPPQGLGEGAGAVTGAALLAEAEALAREAARLKEQVGDLSLEPWTTYGILAGIAEAQGDVEAARGWRRKARATYVAFPGHWERLARQWGQVVQAVAAVARGQAGSDVRAALEEQFERWEQGNWRVTAAFRRLWAGERDAEALTEGIDNNSALIVLKTLEALEGNLTTGSAEVSASAPSEEAQARALMAGLQAWVGTPAGEAALRELQAQGLGQEALVMALLQRFMAARGEGKAGNK